MKKVLIVLFLIYFFSNQLLAQNISESTKISLLTGSPGTELYNTFGHSAIRIKDPALGIDQVYNYGTFNSNMPYFYLKFVRRKVDYALSIENYKDFDSWFRYENRSVIEQELNLTFLQKKNLFALLQKNYMPENRYYRYDFFFDNCATRIRDLMKIAFEDDFQYNYPESWKNNDLTFRNLIDLYLTNHHWSDFGIDIALGLPTDAIATPDDYMFLPDYLAEGFATASIIRDGKEVSFTLPKQTIIPRKDIQAEVFFITPVKLVWTLFIITLIISFLGYKEYIKTHWFDVFYFSLIGVVGWVVFLLWFATDHIATKDNLNVLWAVPIYFPIFFFWNKLALNFKKWFLITFGGVDLFIILFWLVFPQKYHVAFIPLILIILLRFIILFRTNKDSLKRG